MPKNLLWCVKIKLVGIVCWRVVGDRGPQAALVGGDVLDAPFLGVHVNVDPYNEDDNIKASFVKGRWLRSRRRDFPLFILRRIVMTGVLKPLL